MLLRSFFLSFLLLALGTIAAAPIQLGAILAPVDPAVNLAQESGLSAEPAGSEIPRIAKPKYRWIRMHAILSRLEFMVVPEMSGKDRVSLASRSHWDPIKIEEAASWDVIVSTPFVPDARGRWYPSVELIVNGKSQVKRRLTVDVALYREVWQVEQPLAQGSTLGSGQLLATTRDIYSLNGVPVASCEALNGYELIRSVKAGSLLQWSDLRKQPAVRRNALVDVFAQSGGITIRMRGRCMKNGVVGEYVTVRNMDSNREFNAHVLGTGMVKFEL